MSAEKGYFLIADISGYTKFLTSNEIEHAKGILDELFRAIIPAISAPLSISGFQGDAVFAYASDSEATGGQVMLDAAERIYCVFADKRENIIINTSCQCSACTAISELDLKIIIHYGEYVVSKVNGRDELAGRDVISAFRLLKNSVEDLLGHSAYALITCDAVRAMDMDGYFADDAHHVDEYEHIGEIEYVVQPLRPIWEKRREARRIVVSPDGPLMAPEGSVVLPVSVQSAFTIASRPDLRARWMGADKVDMADGKVRIEPEAVMHCHHGSQTTPYEIVDWRPGEYFTGRYDIMGCDMYETVEFSPLGEGTKLTMRTSKLTARTLAGKILRPLLQYKLSRDISGKTAFGFSKMKEIASQMLSEKRGVLTNIETVPEDAGIDAALENRFAA